MNAQHTPGPWAFIGSTLVQDSGNRLHLGKFTEAPGLRQAAEANARLIAAAPELLEALQAIIGHDAHLLNPWRVEAARAAIAKATEA